VGLFATQLTHTAGRATLAQAAMARFGGAARSAAGIGGMVALTQGAQQSNTALKTLANVGGGALLGFSVGGPIGAAVGAGAGGLLSLWQATRKTSNSMSTAKQEAAEYASAIEGIAAASGKAQRAEALSLLQREEGLIPSANALGIATSDLVSGLLGSERAMKRVNNTFRANGQLNIAQGIEIQKVSRFLREQGFAIRDHQNALKDQRQAIRGTDREFAKIPPSVQRVNDSLRNVGKTRSGMGKFTALLRGDLDKARSTSDEQARKINQLLTSTTGKARPNLTPFRADLLRQISATQGAAHSGGMSVGNALEEGVIVGFSSTRQRLAGNAYEAVSEAVASARRAADARSPSRKMMALGKDMADGLAIGMSGGSARSMLSIRSGRGRPVASGAGGGGPVALTITNWRDGTGYFERVADRQIRRDNKYHDRLDDRD
jgi:hypothetical protein